MRRNRGALLRSTALQASALLVLSLPAASLRAVAQPAPSARPQGGQVVAGAAAIAQSTATTTITQSSSRAAIDWRSFDVGSQQSVTFKQPSATSVTLNRVTGPDPSAIAGTINANGQIILTNPSGVTFYQGAQVNAQSVIVSAPGITNRNFMAGRMVFDKAAHPDARVENRGTITVKQAGLAALVAPSVVNSGVINAKLGQVVLAGAQMHTLDMYGDGLVSIDVTGQVKQAPRGPDGKPVTALVTNTGTIIADGGVVQLTAKAADGVVQNLVRAGGHIQANSVGDRTGRIEITGTGGSVVVEGRLAADGKAPGSTGGDVVVMASHTTSVAGGAHISASGMAGGGTIALGTTLIRARGTGAAPAGTSGRTAIAAGARISADARANGNGGRVTVLSTQETEIAGKLTARGGKQSGNGGMIELSGEKGFDLTGTANTSATHGSLGSIVLDPYDLDIVNARTGSLLPGNKAPNVTYSMGGMTMGSPAATVTATSIEGLTGNVELQAIHNLTVKASVTLTGTQTLTLEAGNDLTVMTGTTLTAPGGITLTAASPSSTTLFPTGMLSIQGNLSTDGALALNAGTNGVNLGGALTGASLAINTTGALTQTAASVVNATGAMTFNAGAAGMSLGGTMNAASLVINTTGDVTQGAAGVLNVDTISGNAGTLNLPTTDNFITELAGFTTTGALFFHTGVGLLVSAPVVAGGGKADVTLSSATAGMGHDTGRECHRQKCFDRQHVGRPKPERGWRHQADRRKHHGDNAGGEWRIRHPERRQCGVQSARFRCVRRHVAQHDPGAVRGRPGERWDIELGRAVDHPSYGQRDHHDTAERNCHNGRVVQQHD